MAVFPALKSFVENKIFYCIIFQFRLCPLLGSRVVYFQKFGNILLLTICLNSWTYWTSTPGPNICSPRTPSSLQCHTSGNIHAPNLCTLTDQNIVGTQKISPPPYTLCFPAWLTSIQNCLAKLR